MFQKLASLLTFPCIECIGFCLAQELDDHGKDIMAVFGISDFHRDYEDTWEWVDGKSEDGLHVNISRSHNHKTGEYSVPVVIRMSGPPWKLTDTSLSQYAQALANSLLTEVWIGYVEDYGEDPRHYGFEVKQRFTPIT